uniref:Uncharacterized protein n=1 Tax=Knipowitschia caucasica TaxID=637954 RepID=A0AAV2JPC7_KNICA
MLSRWTVLWSHDSLRGSLALAHPMEVASRAASCCPLLRFHSLIKVFHSRLSLAADCRVQTPPELTTLLRRNDTVAPRIFEWSRIAGPRGSVGRAVRDGAGARPTRVAPLPSRNSCGRLGCLPLLVCGLGVSSLTLSQERRGPWVLGLVEIVAVAVVGMEEAKSGHAGDVTAWPGFLIIPTTASTSTKTNTQGESSSPDSELACRNNLAEEGATPPTVLTTPGQHGGEPMSPVRIDV